MEGLLSTHSSSEAACVTFIQVDTFTEEGENEA